MVRFYKAKSPFDFTWEQVTRKYWQRYLNPKSSSHVLLEDTTYKQIKTDKLYTKRLLRKNHEVPKYRKLWKNPSLIRRIKRWQRIRGIWENSLIMSVAKKVVYRSSDENPDKTNAIHRAKIESYVFGFAKAKQLNT